MARFDTGYVFTGPDRKAGLADLFQGRRQLIVYQMMDLARTTTAMGVRASWTTSVTWRT